MYVYIMCICNIYMQKPREPWEFPSRLCVFVYIYTYVHPTYLCIYICIYIWLWQGGPTVGNRWQVVGSRQSLSAVVINLSQHPKSHAVINNVLRLCHAVSCAILVKSQHSALVLVSLCNGVLVVLSTPQSARQCSEMGAAGSTHAEDSVVYSACQADLTCFHCDSVSMVLQRLRQSGRPSKQHQRMQFRRKVFAHLGSFLKLVKRRGQCYSRQLSQEFGHHLNRV